MTKLYLKNDPRVDAEEIQQYFYHSDHLGSASLISDYKGDEYQRIEYTPYGETWIERTDNNGVDYLPYRFTCKELDEETGLYYYGARYLDPKYSTWISTDPALGDYIPQAPVNDEARRHNQNLPGMGGIFNHINNNLYAYAANNPVKYTDPDGRKLFVSGTKEYMAKVQRELTKLCPGARINFDTGEVTLSTSSKDTQGYKLLSTLIDSEKSNTIWIGDSRQIDLTSGPYGNSVRCYDTKIALSNGELIGDYTTVDGKIGGPMNTVINFDPDNVFGGKNDNGSNVRPPFVGLAHECGHSEAINNGTQTYEKPVYIPGTTPSREENSLKWENLIRKEHRLTPRSNYFYKPKEKPEGE